jgi:lysylphosphatidylglycerol synthetase-like protein (DUF2156 family)
MELLTYPREKTIKLLRLWGTSPADASLDSVCKHFIIPEIEGFVPYRVESGCAIVFGDPVCSLSDRAKLVSAFHQYCQEKKNSIVYLIASKQFSQWAIHNQCSSSIEFGEELFLNPQQDQGAVGSEGALLRKKIRKALREGVKIKEHDAYDFVFEKKIEETIKDWLDARKGPQVYIAHVRLFQDRFGRRWFYAMQKDQIVAVAILNRLEAKQGWLLSQIFLSPQAPVGASESIVDGIIKTLKNEHCSYLTFGAVPAQELKDIQGLNFFSSWLIRRVFSIARKLFHLDGKRVFWQKFQPKGEASYVLFSGLRIKIRDIIGIIRALNVSI